MNKLVQAFLDLVWENRQSILFTANTNENVWEKVYDLYCGADPNRTADYTDKVLVWKIAYNGKLRTMCSEYGLQIQDGWSYWHVPNANSGTADWRIYFNPLPGFTLVLFKYILEVLGAPGKPTDFCQNNFNQMKVADEEQALSGRFDKIVVWVRNEEAAKQLIRALEGKDPNYIAGMELQIPHMSMPLGQGIAIGKQPSNKNTTFGIVRSKAVATALINVLTKQAATNYPKPVEKGLAVPVDQIKGPQTPYLSTSNPSTDCAFKEIFEQQAQLELLAAGVDIERPWL
jgi:HopA1 effector protein family